MFSDWRRSHTSGADVFAANKANLARLAAVVGEDWRSSPYYDDAEQYLESAWVHTIRP